jgi:hypothetical protein
MDQHAFLLRNYFLTVFSLRSWRFSILQFIGKIRALKRRGGSIPKGTEAASLIDYSLPFEGVWVVVNGGVTKKLSHSWGLLDQRFAYDFVLKDDIEKLANHGAYDSNSLKTFGSAILAPADGIVVSLKSNIQDSSPPYSSNDWDIRGNHIILKHAPNEYSVLAHLMKGSIVVKKGESVSRQQLLAQCGNSGNSSLPHLHFQVQDIEDSFSSVGIPISFSSITITRQNLLVEGKFIQKDDEVCNHDE